MQLTALNKNSRIIGKQSDTKYFCKAFLQLVPWLLQSKGAVTLIWGIGHSNLAKVVLVITIQKDLLFCFNTVLKKIQFH